MDPAVLEDAIASGPARPWLELLLAQIYILAGQGDTLEKKTLIEDEVFEMADAAAVIDSRKY